MLGDGTSVPRSLPTGYPHRQSKARPRRGGDQRSNPDVLARVPRSHEDSLLDATGKDESNASHDACRAAGQSLPIGRQAFAARQAGVGVDRVRHPAAKDNTTGGSPASCTAVEVVRRPLPPGWAHSSASPPWRPSAARWATASLLTAAAVLAGPGRLLPRPSVVRAFRARP